MALLTFAGLGDMGKNMSAALNIPPAKPAADYSEVRRVASQGAGNLKPSHLMNELSNSGVKHNAADVTMVARTQNGQLVWLEKGNNNAGLTHIANRHASDFAKKGVNVSQIPEYLREAVVSGRVVGTQNTRPIYEFVFNGQIHRAAIDIGSNGFIVGANPSSAP